MSSEFCITIGNGEGGFRIDKAVSNHFTDLSRSQVQKSIKDGLLRVNNQIISNLSHKVKEGDIITFDVKDKINQSILPSEIPLEIIFEDEDLIVLNKAAGMVTHPGSGVYNDTLVNALLHHTNSLSDFGDETRPGIVHRLDKDTSGIMVVAKNNYAHISLSDQIKDRSLKRKYKALVWGMMNPLYGTIELEIAKNSLDRKKMSVVDHGGKRAVTHYTTLEIFAGGTFSLLECQLETGRTHQIRVHLNHMRHPIVGDPTYFNSSIKSTKLEAYSGSSHESDDNLLIKQSISTIKTFNRQALHSFYIGFNHPRTGEFMEFDIDLPVDFKNLLDSIKSLP